MKGWVVVYIKYKNMPAITAWASVVGKKESEGPLANLFGECCQDDYFGKETWEQAETEMQSRCIKQLLHKKQISTNDIKLFMGGDLCNQITSTAFSMRDFGFPFLGLYNACSTMAESMIISACMVDAGYADNSIAMASSHFCTAERQYRTPLDYGGKRTPTAQWTVTGCGSVLIEPVGKTAFIDSAQIGAVVDLGVTDTNNMGAAMAPAAADTIKKFLKNSKTKASDYDLIVTGDLGAVGSGLLKELLEKENISLDNHFDCGLEIYSEEQHVQSGASGCGCSASVLTSKLLPEFEEAKLNNILFIATGALLSPSTSMQGESIPCIAHLVNIKSKKEVRK